MKRYDAIVIGGGPAGATAALLLARAGWSIAVVERSPYPRGKVCGEYIAPPALALLHDMGVGHIVDEAGPEVRRIAVWNHGTRVTAVMPAYGDERARYGRALSREACDARLLQHAVEAGAELWQPYRAIELRGKAGAFECDVERAGAVATLHARCIIAAHGSWEAGRLPTQVKRASAKPDDLFGFKAYFSHVALARDLLPLMSFAGGYAGMVNTSGGRVNLSCCVRRDALERVRALYPGRPAGDALLAFLQRENKVARLAMVAAERLSPWLACGPLHPGRRRSAVPGVYAIGNAAGEAHPLVGEGISLAIQSAALLCATLSDAARSGQWERAARMYECAWRHAFTPRLRLSACYANMAMRPRWARAITGWLSYMPQLLTLGARWSGKTCGHIFSSAFTATR